MEDLKDEIDDAAERVKDEIPERVKKIRNDVVEEVTGKKLDEIEQRKRDRKQKRMELMLKVGREKRDTFSSHSILLNVHIIFFASIVPKNASGGERRGR